MPSSGGSSSSLSNKVTGRRTSPSRLLTRRGGTSLARAGKPDPSNSNAASNWVVLQEFKNTTDKWNLRGDVQISTAGVLWGMAAAVGLAATVAGIAAEAATAALGAAR